eukprot:4286170-Amphidinium_carterae.1
MIHNMLWEIERLVASMQPRRWLPMWAGLPGKKIVNSRSRMSGLVRMFVAHVLKRGSRLKSLLVDTAG